MAGLGRIVPVAELTRRRQRERWSARSAVFGEIVPQGFT